MKPLAPLCLILFSFSCLSSSAQAFADILKTAKKENKIVMVVVESEKCTQCNEVANQGLSSEVARRAINASCILLREKKIPDELQNTYAPYSFSDDFFGAIYVDAEKNILQIYRGSASFYKAYLDNLEKALKEKDNSDPKLNELINNYYNKTGTFDVIIQLVEKLKKIGLEPKGELLDDLVQKVPADSVASLTFLQFVLRAAPVVGSNAQIFVEKNRDNYNMAWYRMPQQERVTINNSIYQKSIQKAIANKDLTYMYRVASTRQSTILSQPEKMQQIYLQTLLQYYKGVHDSSNYLINAARFYDSYFMNITVDSVLRIDSIKRAGLFKNIPNRSGAVVVQTVTQTIGFTPLASYYAGALNDGAWTLYTYTKNPVYLGKALLWSKRANEFTDQPEIMDTYARILYKTGNKEVAITMEAKAIEAKKSKNLTVTDYEKVLDAMKNGMAKIDEY